MWPYTGIGSSASVDHCFSHTHGIKVDTIIIKTKQGAANTADLFISHKVTEREQTLAPSTDPDSFKTLAQLNFKDFWGLGRIFFWTLKEEKGEPKAENTTSKLTSQ
jgi:hypothetical protein